MEDESTSHCSFDQFLDDLQVSLQDYDTEDQDPRVRTTIMMMMRAIDDHKTADSASGFTCDYSSQLLNGRVNEMIERQSRETERETRNVVRALSPVRPKTLKQPREIIYTILGIHQGEVCAIASQR